jgi:hypothetical protein
MMLMVVTMAVQEVQVLMNLGLMVLVRSLQHRDRVLLLAAVTCSMRVVPLQQAGMLLGLLVEGHLLLLLQQQLVHLVVLTTLLLVAVGVLLEPVAAAPCWLVHSCRTAIHQSS